MHILKEFNLRISNFGNICVNDIMDNIIFPHHCQDNINYPFIYYVSTDLCLRILDKFKKENNNKITNLVNFLENLDDNHFKIYTIYLISTEDKAKQNIFKVVNDYDLTEDKILEELDKYRIINATGNKSEWINMEKDNLIDVINKNISTHDYGKNIEIFKNIVPNFNIYETLEHNYIMFEKSNIHVIIDDDDRIWFSVKDTLLALGYKDYKDAIKRHVDKKYVKEKQYINYEHLSGQPRTLYITESGLYKMITRSRLPKAIRFTDWIFDDLLPKIRKFGKYQLKKNYDNEMSELSKKINFLEKQNKIFKSDLKKEKFPKGGVVYVIDYSDENEEIYRIGMTGNMKTRKRLYNTHTLHNHNNIMIKETPCPIKLESCLRSLLYDYRYKNNKDFYLCPLIKIKNALKYCQQNIKKCSVNQSGGGSKTNKITHFKSMIDHMISKNKIQKKRIKNKIIKLGKILDND